MKPSEQGFTLIELLAAMAVSALLLALLGWVVASFGRDLTRARGNAQTDQVEAVRPMLAAMIEGASPDIATALRFEGRADGLTAIVPPIDALGAVGPVKLELAVRREADGEALYAAFAAVDHARTLPAIAAEPKRLLAGFERIDFDYVRRDSRSGLSTPALVRINLRAAGRALSPLVIAPKLASSGACNFDTISMTCRR